MNLDQVDYCPRCGSAVTQTLQFGRLRPTCPQCHWIYFADPKVAAAVLILQARTQPSTGQQDQQVLLVQRANEPLRGKWTLPAGFVDAGEDPAEAAVREAFEETGLVVHVTGLFDVIAGKEHPRGAHILIVYRAEIDSGECKPGDDATGAAFFSLYDLPSLAFQATQTILSKLKN